MAVGEDRRASAPGPPSPEKPGIPVPATVGAAWASRRRTRLPSTTYTRSEPSTATATGCVKATLALVITANGGECPDLVAQYTVPATTVVTTNKPTAAKPRHDRPRLESVSAGCGTGLPASRTGPLVAGRVDSTNHAATWARDRHPSFARICSTCASAVRSEMTSRSAICRLLNPAATSPA